MDPTGSDVEDSQDSINYTPTWSWYRNQSHDFYRYVRDDNGFVQKVYDDPRNYNKSKTRPTTINNVGRDTPAPAPALKKPAFVLPKPPKYFLEESPPIVGADGEFGPSKLETANFHSQGSEGVTAWYTSQFMRDLDHPPPETPTPANLATVFVHRNSKDGGYQVWVWLDQSGRGWQPVDLKDFVHHPDFPSRVLKLTAAGKPNWILESSLITERTRQKKKLRQSSLRLESSGGKPSG